MRTAYDRNEAKRLNQEVALDHISIQKELEQVEARQDDAHERDLHERKEKERQEYVRVLADEHAQETLEENAMAMIHGSRERGQEAYHQMHEMDHRGEFINPEESHFAFDDRYTRGHDSNIMISGFDQDREVREYNQRQSDDLRDLIHDHDDFF